MTARRRREFSLPFLAVPHYVLRSAAFRTLSPPATKLLFAVGEKYRGDNNGELEMPFGELTRDWYYRSHHTISRAIAELLNTGLLVRTRQGRRFGGTPAPSLYALAWHPIPASDRHPVREIHPRLTPQVQKASAPRALVKQKQVQPEHLLSKKTPFSTEPENEVMRVSQVHYGFEQVHPEHHLSRSMPYRDGLYERSLLNVGASISDDLIRRECGLVTSRSRGRFCTPLGGSPITKRQLAYLKFQNRAADPPMRPPG